MKDDAGRSDAASAATAAVRFPWELISALALAQLVAWGTLFYAFAIVSEAMGRELGWAKAEMSGALSLGLAVTGISAYGVGRWIDRRGGRLLMMIGAVLGAVLLALWSAVTEIWQLYAVWAGIGLASAMVLYDPVFAVVARALPGHYRRAITTITLLGGLASTVFIPTTHLLVEALGWRHALVALALIELPLCAGIPWILLHGRETGGLPASAHTAHRGVVRRAMRHPTFWLLAVSYVGAALFQTSVLFNLVPMLGELGFTTAEAVAAYTCIGPSQVLGRIALLTLERHLTTTVAGLVGTIPPLIGMAVLSLAEPSPVLVFGFAIAFGLGAGVKTIVQATAAPELLGREGYGALQGAIMTPVYVAHAVAPFAAAMVWQVGGGYELVRQLLVLVGATSALAFVLAVLFAPKHQH